MKDYERGLWVGFFLTLASVALGLTHATEGTEGLWARLGVAAISFLLALYVHTNRKPA